MNSCMNIIHNDQLTLQPSQKQFIFNLDKQDKIKSLNKGFWNDKEQFKYVRFLENNMEIMSFGFLRVQYSIFRKMAKFIKSRSTAQCKSHHQKMLLKAHGQLINIVRHYKEKIYPRLINSRVFLTQQQKLINNEKNAQKVSTKSRQINISSSFYQISVKQSHIKIIIDDRFIKSY